MNKEGQWIIGAAVISFVLSVYMWFTTDKSTGIFVGLWVPSLLILATYIKK